METQVENKMGVAPINSLLLKMAAPMIFSMLIGALYNVVDSMFVARLGENALTAVSLAFPVQSIIIACGNGIGVGISSNLSKYLGAGEPEKANASAKNGLVVGIAMYLLFLLFGIFGVKWFLIYRQIVKKLFLWVVIIFTSYPSFLFSKLFKLF